MNQENANTFIGYEYKTVITSSDKASFYLDCYENFGWVADMTAPMTYGTRQTVIKLKRDRKIINKAELTRLQRNFEACVEEIAALERSRNNVPTAWAISAGIVGTAFMAGSVFAVTHTPPIIWLCVLLAIPGFAGWILPYFLFCRSKQKQIKKVQPLIDAKYDEVYTICEKGHSLL